MTSPSPPPHPGHILLREFLEPLGLTQTELARRIEVPFQRLNSLVNGRRRMTPDTALRLARAFGTASRFWMDHQLRWDLFDAERQAAGTLARIEPIPRREGEGPVRDRPPWMLDELASAGRENLDAVHASRYDAKEDADAEQEVRRLRAAGLDPRSRVVDLGAGTGQFTLAVADACASVIAVDVSPVMLDVLRKKLAASGRGNVEVVQAGFLTYEHRGRPADFVYSRFALHHLPDFWKGVALTRMRSLLRRDGALRLWDIAYHCDPGESEKRMAAWCATLDQGTSDAWTRADIEEHVRDEHSTFTWLLEPLIERSGFTIEEATYSPDGVMARYLARAI